MTSRFCHYQLRTKDMNAARAFYADIFGSQFWDAGVSLIALPERAAAQGAPAHWLGHIGVHQVDAIAGRIVALGGQPLGPTQRAAEGRSVAVLRDPFGAVMALSSETGAPQRAPVTWHLLSVHDEVRAFAAYAVLFGWTATERVDLGPGRGCHQMFAWEQAGTNVGSVASTARSPQIHTQWLFFFPVADLEASRARVQAAGGLALEAIDMSNGDLVAPCDDAQGAAFGLYQVRA
jgi:predicted enzyme related to lactoylglutathione lyase